MKKSPRFTGKVIPTKDVDLGYKKGVLCLRCGIHTGGSLCENCVHYKKCKLCGILCRPQESYKHYFYFIDKKNPDQSKEFYKEVIPKCQKLDNHLCETCVFWEQRIKNNCFTCGEKFTNDFKNYKENGNFCKNCSLDIKLRLKLYNKNGELKRDLSTEQI